MKRKAVIAIVGMLISIASLNGCLKTESQNAGDLLPQTVSPSAAKESATLPAKTPEEGILRSTEDDPDYLDDMSAFPLSMDYNSDGDADLLSVELIDEPDDELNYPTAIKLTINGHEEFRSNLYGDGIGLKIIDLDTEDTFLDICVFAYGTDVSVIIFIYRYDGKEIDHYKTFNVEDVSFSYDAKGMIYYNTFLDKPDNFRHVRAAYDYRNNTVSYIDID